MADNRKKRGELTQDIREVMYFHIHKMKHFPEWRGVKIDKFPTDMSLYAEAIFETKPDWIIETGTQRGGSSLFFADLLLLINSPGKVISIDIESYQPIAHPKVEYVIGSSIDDAVVSHIKDSVSGKVMVVLDSSHLLNHVSRELEIYSEIVTAGQYLVVEDCYFEGTREYYPKTAVDTFLSTTDKFTLEPNGEKYLFAVTRGGWLKRNG